MFLLEVKVGFEWSREGHYSTLSDVATYAEENFPQNEWQVRNEESEHPDVIVLYSSPSSTINSLLRGEAERFNRTNYWREHFVRSAVERRATERQAVERDRQRRVLAASQNVFTRRNLIDELFGDYEECNDFKEIIDWAKEGF